MGHGLGGESDSSSLSSAPPSPTTSRPSSPFPTVNLAAAPPPFGKSKHRKPAPTLDASLTPVLPEAASRPTKATRADASSSTPKAATSLLSTTAPSGNAPAPPKKRTYQQRKHPVQFRRPANTASSEETSVSTEDEKELRKPRKRRAQPKVSPGPATATPSCNPATTIPKPDSSTAPNRGKVAHRSRVSASRLPATFLAQPEPASSRPALPPLASMKLETRPPSFLTKSIVPIPGTKIASGKQRAKVWSYSDLDGLIWVKLDLGGTSDEKVKVAYDDQTEGMLCWWPGQVTDRTPNCLKLILCGTPPTISTTSVVSLELLPSSLSEFNVLTFRSASSVRFSTLKAAYNPRPPSTYSGLGELPGERLEAAWKTACTRAFEIDAERNDGLEDIFLLFSQKSRSERDEYIQGGTADPTEVEDEGYKTDEADVLEVDTVVLCRYRTGYYPAKVCKYYPRGERGPRGKYMCRFADDSTRIAARHEIHTQLDPGFAKCPLGRYTEKASNYPRQSWLGRPPTPEPRASSPEPAAPEPKVNTTEYCALERMRDQLKPVLPFLQGIISRTYIPGQGAEGADQLLDRHAVYMQGGRARKNLAYSVYTGDLNEDDCEALMYEVSRWALRGERWAGWTNKESRGVSGVVPAIVVGAPAITGTSDEPKIEDVRMSTGVVKDPLIIEGVGDQDVKMAIDSPADQGTLAEAEVAEGMPSSGMAMGVEDAARTEPTDQGIERSGAQPEGCSTPSTVAEDVEDNVTPVEVELSPDNPSFRELLDQQPPRPIGNSDYERLAPGERMGYVSDVLYPEAAAFILSYRRGIRTQVGPVPNPQTEFALYKAGAEVARNTVGQEDWVDKILATRQLREAALHKNGFGDGSEQVVVAGGTRSRPKYVPSKSVLR